jgi:hypothetical protein
MCSTLEFVFAKQEKKAATSLTDTDEEGNITKASTNTQGETMTSLVYILSLCVFTRYAHSSCT